MKIKPQKVPCPTCGTPGKGLRFTGEQLRAAREIAGLSLREVARRGGLSAGYLSDVELERRRVTPAVVALYEGLE